jgi:RND family efflux transporter MFP subunit
VQVAVPEMETPLVRAGQPVKISLESLPGRAFEGKVSRYSFALDDLSKTMLVEADLSNPDLVLRPGMYATVRIGLEQHTNSLLAPVEAVVMEKTSTFLFRSVDGKAKKTPVKIGFNDGVSAEIIEGAQANELVVLVGKSTLVVDGQAVTISEAR